VPIKQKFSKSCNMIMENHVEARGTHTMHIPSFLYSEYDSKCKLVAFTYIEDSNNVQY